MARKTLISSISLCALLMACLFALSASFQLDDPGKAILVGVGYGLSVVFSLYHRKEKKF